MRAYDVSEVNRWVPAQVSMSSLDRGTKLQSVIGCVKAPREARNRQPEAFILLIQKSCLDVDDD